MILDNIDVAFKSISDTNISEIQQRLKVVLMINLSKSLTGFQLEFIIYCFLRVIFVNDTLAI